MNSNNPYIQGQINLKFLVKAKSIREYNNYLFNLVNISNKSILRILDIFCPFIIFLNVVLTLCFVIVKFIVSLISYKWRVDENEYQDFDELYLFFINHFLDRCKAAKFYDKSKYWIVSPDIDKKKYNIDGKVILDYRAYLSKGDAFRIVLSSLAFLIEYILKLRSICFIHKIWDFYEVKYSLRRIGKNSIFYYSNQSDKFALLFDQIESKGKVLFQHGIVANWGNLPYKLENVSIFYAMADSTWKDAYNHLLKGNPLLKIMDSTIQLSEIPSASFSVLIVSDISCIDVERQILDELSKNKKKVIYLKKHPALVNDGCYRELEHKYGFHYIVDKIFPKVDFVISYYSTLAYEYMALGTPVYMYTDKVKFCIDKMIAMMNKYIKNKAEAKISINED